MSTARRLFVGGASKTALAVLQVLVGFFMMPFLVHHLGDRWYGIWTILGSVIGYYHLFDFGLAATVQRFVAGAFGRNDTEGANITVNMALVLYSALALLIFTCTVLLYLVIDRFVDDPRDAQVAGLVLLILGFSFSLEFPFKAFAGLASAKLRYELLSLNRMAVLLLNAALTVFFLSSGYGIVALALISFICTQISNIGFFLISRSCFPDLRIDLRLFRREQVPELLGYSWWSFLATISSHLKFRVDSLVIGYFLGPVQVTHYFIGARLVEYFRTVIIQTTDIAMPVLARYHALNQENILAARVMTLTKLNGVLAAFAGGFLCLIGERFITLWMGDGYQQSYAVLVILALASTFELLLQPTRSALFAAARNRPYALSELVEALCNVVLSIALVQGHGLVGVALGTAIPLFLIKMVFVPLYAARALGLGAVRLYGAMLGPVALAAAFLLLVGQLANPFLANGGYIQLLVTGAGAAGLFLVLAYRLVFDEAERRMLLSSLPMAKLHIPGR
ncbi:MAG: oligosaccharide flippase family protein [Gammaproteobacteria bacterium]|nr:oligosaccharide flippase family protein [Gammaproteobacteria bacterium]